jgi:hypothetical protein
MYSDITPLVMLMYSYITPAKTDKGIDSYERLRFARPVDNSRKVG